MPITHILHIMSIMSIIHNKKQNNMQNNMHNNRHNNQHSRQSMIIKLRAVGTIPGPLLSAIICITDIRCIMICTLCVL